MKVVLFCGGLGMRLRDYSDKVPKPMVEVGYRPILWHVMKYYAAQGHKDFILCLGYKADVIKRYFVDYDEYLSNDFVLRGSETGIDLQTSDLHDWNITFVDTGYSSSIGERLRLVREHLDGEEMFLANYSDNVTDFPVSDLVGRMRATDCVAGFLAIRPPHSFHVARIDGSDSVTSIHETRDAELWINGGYFCLRNEIFDYLHEGEELVIEPFQRLIQEQRLMAIRYEGFWQNMDTFKDCVHLNELHERAEAPWEIWRK
ncbi:MAG: sugar phosphate nucleotidyltransferase [Planctomycetota bacterium]